MLPLFALFTAFLSALDLTEFTCMSNGIYLRTCTVRKPGLHLELLSVTSELGRGSAWKMRYVQNCPNWRIRKDENRGVGKRDQGMEKVAGSTLPFAVSSNDFRRSSFIYDSHRATRMSSSMNFLKVAKQLLLWSKQLRSPLSPPRLISAATFWA
jgi:hypothetical protein